MTLCVALFRPEIPPNTGNIIRLCANTGAELHLIHPLGFVLEDAKLRRAGLDYHEWARVHQHANLTAFREALPQARWLAFTTKAQHRHDQIAYQSGDVLLFGSETAGLPSDLLDSLPEHQRLRIPMQPAVRSLNLSNAVAVAVYEAWRQGGFPGASGQADTQQP